MNGREYGTPSHRQQCNIIRMMLILFSVCMLYRGMVKRDVGETCYLRGVKRVWDGSRWLCVHLRRPYRCADCKGSAVCKHGRRRSRCNACHGQSRCKAHNRRMDRCSECNPCGYVRHTLRKRLRKALMRDGVRKNGKTLKYHGADVHTIHKHIECQFVAGMGWHNACEWHIDHRRPCASFDLTKKGERDMCFHYTNLQPMWKAENMRKGAKFDKARFGYEWDGRRWSRVVYSPTREAGPG